MERGLINTFSKQLLDWRWESLGNLLDKLVPITPILLKYWKLEEMRSGGDALSAIENGHVAAVDKLLTAPWVHPNFGIDAGCCTHSESVVVLVGRLLHA